MSLLRLLEHVHGHLGWLAVAVLVHPAIVLRRRGRRAHVAVVLAVGLPLLTATLGVFLYGPYRENLRLAIFQSAPRVGWMFERKEHLAFALVAVAVSAGAAYLGSWRVEGALRARLHAYSHRAFVVAAALAIAVATLGTYVAVYKSF